jgi:hypothetical protein
MSAQQNKNYFFCSATHGYGGDPGRPGIGGHHFVVRHSQISGEEGSIKKSR